MRILGYHAFAFLQAPVVSEPAEGFGDLFGLIARQSLVGHLVLATLLAFSVISWAIILFKLWHFRQADAQTSTFIAIFRKSRKFSEVQSVSKSLPASPLTGVFQAGYVELNAQLRDTDAPRGDPLAGGAPRPTLRSFEALDRSLLRATTIEVNKLERHVPVLATTASITPFIGLFGTVVGIIIAFQEIGTTGSTNLAVVAPGIAEALIATAAGLFAAIPAVYYYNHLMHRVRLMASAMDDFSLEFLNIAERYFPG